MSAPSLFDWFADRIVLRTSLSRVEARGMLRVVLRECGLPVETLAPAQLRPVVQRMLGPALQRVKVAYTDAVCESLLKDLEESPAPSSAGEDAAAVFGRMGGRKA